MSHRDISWRVAARQSRLKWQVFPLLVKEGWPRHQKMVLFRKGAAGVVARESRFATRFDTLRVGDHPVCGASVASRLFINAAATPPSQGGECACINSSRFLLKDRRRDPEQKNARRQNDEERTEAQRDSKCGHAGGDAPVPEFGF